MSENAPNISSGTRTSYKDYIIAKATLTDSRVLSRLEEALNNPQLQSFMKQLNITLTGPVDVGNNLMIFKFTDNGSTVSGLGRAFKLYTDDNLSGGVLAKRLIASLEARTKLKEALKNAEVLAKVKEFKIDLNDIDLMSLGAIDTLFQRLWNGGARSSEFSITINVNLSVEQMVKELLIEIPKFSKLKSDYVGKYGK